ncbi:MAG TPA: cupredoxin domain-containing protein [Anaeromyxobacter sp.]
MRALPSLAAALALSVLPLAASAKGTHSSDHHATPATYQISVTSDGFVPASIKVKRGEPVRLVVTRKTDRTCATEIVIKDHGINQPLPLDKPVTVELTPKKSGQVRYACGMDMIYGVLQVE